MTKKLTAAILALGFTIGVIFAMSQVAKAQTNANCGTFEQAEALVKEYKEIPLVTFRDDKGGVIMIYGNPETRTVTVFVAPPGTTDMVCIISSGGDLMIGGKKSNAAPKKSADEYLEWSGNQGWVNG